MSLLFDPHRYEVRMVDEAKQLILTQEGVSVEERWQTETPYLLDLFHEALGVGIDENGILLDFGCGIGRLSKGLIERYGCHVVGVDTSPSMCALAYDYVRSPRFLSCAPPWLSLIDIKPYLSLTRTNFTAILCVWVLQHVAEPQKVVEALRPLDAPVFVVNDVARSVPCRAQDGSGIWVDDGINIREVMRLAGFMEQRFMRGLDPRFVAVDPAASSWWGVYS